jgi:xylan 1,4-beta-xylosidase
MTRSRPRIVTTLAALVLAQAADAQTARFDSFSYDGRSQERVVVAPSQYRNPILSGYYPDPSVTRVGDDYYLVNSSFAHFPGLPIFKSKDLVSWVQIGNAISRPSQLDLAGRGLSQAVFAPDISWHAGVFYIVNTCVQCKGNFVITAKDAAGPWSDPIWLPFEGIDPSIYWEGDKAYIVNNRAPDEPPRYDGHRAIWVQEYDWRAGKMVGPSTQIVNGGVDLATKPVWIEGPHLIRHDDFFYLIAAEGGTGDNHSEVVFRSKSLTGPFVPYPDNPILTQRGLAADRANPVTSAGHAKFVQTQNGDWWATFLATRPYAPERYAIGRETFLLPVTWSDGWPHILAPKTPIPFATTKPRLPAQPRPTTPVTGDFAYSDAFAGKSLAMQWIGIRAPATPFHTLGAGGLTLRSRAALGDRQGVPAFLGRRQQHHIATITTRVTFAPRTDGARAGLAAVQNDESFLFFGITRIAGKPVVALYARDKAQADTLVTSAPVDPSGPVTLTIRADKGVMAFDYQTRAGRRTLLSNFDATLLTTARAGGFVGTVVGPYVYDPAAGTS